jgi:hypothetical protein
VEVALFHQLIIKNVARKELVGSPTIKEILLNTKGSGAEIIKIV